MPGAEPVEQLVVGRPAASTSGSLARSVTGVSRPSPGEHRGPPVHVALVSQQVADLPRRARGHWRVEPGPLRRGGEQVAVALDCPDVLGYLHADSWCQPVLSVLPPAC